MHLATACRYHLTAVKIKQKIQKLKESFYLDLEQIRNSKRLQNKYSQNTYRLATSVAIKMLRSFALNLFRAPSRLF